MKEFKNGTYTGERVLFATKDAYFEKCLFKDGESPLKESSNLKINWTTFRWKYPLWYCKDVLVENSVIEETARSGIWYTKNITMNNCQIDSPKTFRRAENIELNSCDIPHAQETFWSCKKIKLNQVTAKGDYFGMNSEDIDITGFNLDGNYCFDGAKNIVIRNSTLLSKDSFWNSENVTVINSKIVGEYLAWNSKNLTFINCTIESHQGLCYKDFILLFHKKHQNNPSTVPSEEIVILTPAGTFERPGINNIEPQMTTKKPAPDLISISLTVTSKFFGAPKRFASSLKLYCVFAIITGNLS